MRDIVIYGKAGCNYCTLAKEYLDKLGIEYDYIDINKDFDAAMDLMEEFGVFRTVPQIVIDNELIGGYTELVNKVK